jgi:hypothetical protein
MTRMKQVRKTAEKLMLICRRHGDFGVAPGATDSQVREIEEVFAQLRYPLPDDLLDLYRLTLGIPGITNDLSILVAPCQFSWPGIEMLDLLITQRDDPDAADILWLGYGNDGSLIMDRKGRFGVTASRRKGGTAEIVDPTDFPTAFDSFVHLQIECIRGSSD